MTTFKPYIGHTLGVSALIETAILLLSLKNGIVPATLNCDNIDPRFNISLVNKTIDKKLDFVMKASCAFAGFNAAAVFRKV